MGAVVLVVAALFLFFAYSTSQVRAVQGYEVTAQFDSVTGIRDGERRAPSPGSRWAQGDARSQTFPRRCTDEHRPAYKLPDDTVAEILSAGLLGDFRGRSERRSRRAAGSNSPQSPVHLENLIGQMIFSQPGAQKKPGEGEAPSK